MERACQWGAGAGHVVDFELCKSGLLLRRRRSVKNVSGLTGNVLDILNKSLKCFMLLCGSVMLHNGVPQGAGSL